MRIETALAKASLTRVDRRDPYKTHPQDEARGPELTLAPNFDWSAYFAASAGTRLSRS